jgi:hypothetical protein
VQILLPVATRRRFLPIILTVDPNYYETNIDAETEKLLRSDVEFIRVPHYPLPAYVGRGTLRREGWELAEEPVHGALHSQARQLAEPSGDRHQSVLLAMPGQTPDRRSSFSAQGNSGLEPPYES